MPGMRQFYPPSQRHLSEVRQLWRNKRLFVTAEQVCVGSIRRLSMRWNCLFRLIRRRSVMPAAGVSPGISAPCKNLGEAARSPPLFYSIKGKVCGRGRIFEGFSVKILVKPLLAGTRGDSYTPARKSSEFALTTRRSPWHRKNSLLPRKRNNRWRRKNAQPR